jgi:galactose-1-phosphate uridylyltransferase
MHARCRLTFYLLSVKPRAAEKHSVEPHKTKKLASLDQNESPPYKDLEAIKVQSSAQSRSIPSRSCPLKRIGFQPNVGTPDRQRSTIIILDIQICQKPLFSSF